jgi:hypothetical protein
MAEEKEIFIHCPVGQCRNERLAGNLGICDECVRREAVQCENCYWVCQAYERKALDNGVFCEGCWKKIKKANYKKTCPVKTCSKLATEDELGLCSTHENHKQCEICFHVLSPDCCEQRDTLGKFACRSCTDRVRSKNPYLDDPFSYPDMCAAHEELVENRIKTASYKKKKALKGNDDESASEGEDSEEDSDEDSEGEDEEVPIGEESDIEAEEDSDEDSDEEELVKEELPHQIFKRKLFKFSELLEEPASKRRKIN